MDVVILLSNTCLYLPIQLYMIKKYIRQVNTITFVVGPYGMPRLNRSPVYLIEGDYKVIQPDIEKNETKADIYRWIWSSFKQTHTLVLDCDIFPYKPMIIAQMCDTDNGARLGCKWLGGGGKKYPQWQFWHHKLDSLGFEGNGIRAPDEIASVMPYKKIEGQDTRESHKMFLPFNSVEYCEPGFIHLGDVSSDSLVTIQAKYNALERFVTRYHDYDPGDALDICSDVSGWVPPVGFERKTRPLPQDGISLIKRYAEERAIWAKAGKPMRKPEVVEQMFEEHCKPCDYFIKKSDGRGTCGLCGCSAKSKGTILNKLAWATTNCPDGRWSADVEAGE